MDIFLDPPKPVAVQKLVTSKMIWDITTGCLTASSAGQFVRQDFGRIPLHLSKVVAKSEAGSLQIS